MLIKIDDKLYVEETEIIAVSECVQWIDAVASVRESYIELRGNKLFKTSLTVAQVMDILESKIRDRQIRR